MKKYLYYLIIFLGISALLSELINHFEEIKLSYATLDSEKYFEVDEFQDTISHSTRGSNGTIGISRVYYGKLVNQKKTSRITSYPKKLDKIRLKNGNIPVWFCNIKGASKLILRTKNNPPNKPFFKIYFYIFCWFGSIYSVICLNIMKKRKHV